MEWAEEGLLLADCLRSWGEQAGMDRWITSLGGRALTPENPVWGFPISLQYKRPLGFGNLARRVGPLEAFTYTHSGTASKENYDPEITFPTLDLNSHLHLGGGTTTWTPG